MILLFMKTLKTHPIRIIGINRTFVTVKNQSVNRYQNHHGANTHSSDPTKDVVSHQSKTDMTSYIKSLKEGLGI